MNSSMIGIAFDGQEYQDTLSPSMSSIHKRFQ
jgi:hypothetical protein